MRRSLQRTLSPTPRLACETDRAIYRDDRRRLIDEPCRTTAWKALRITGKLDSNPEPKIFAGNYSPIDRPTHKLMDTSHWIAYELRFTLVPALMLSMSVYLRLFSQTMQG